MKNMHELFAKYLNNDCSPEEVKQLLAYFDLPENEDILRGFIKESMEHADAVDGSRWIPFTNKMFAEIKFRLDADKAKVIPIYKKTWFRLAAASVILVGAFAVFNLTDTPQKNQDIVKAGPANQETAPGRNKAILTLADGSNLILENAENGTLARQGNTKIEKLAHGQLAYTLSQEEPGSIFYNKLATPRGGLYQMILSDGSKVWINAASSLRFPAAFAGNERKVELTGEAYFEVATNASVPFKINVAGKGEVEVLGTHFNVSAYNDEVIMKTTLLRGSVKLVGMKTGSSTIINPGQQAQLHDNGKISLNNNADTEQAIAWKNGTFNFNNTDLGMVLRELSRWYDLDIVLEGPLPVRQFGGEIQRDLQLQQVLKLLEKNNVNCRLEGKKLIIKK